MPRSFLAPYKFEIVGSSGQSFFNFLDSKKNEFYLDKNDQTFLRLDSVNFQNNKAWGYIKYGKYGARSDVIDVNTRQITKTIEFNESVVDEYFYLIEYDSSTNSGYMVLQRIGNVGVRTALLKALTIWGLNIKIEPILLGLRELLNNPIMEFRIKVPKRPRDVDRRLEKLEIQNEEDIYVEVIIKSKKNKSLQLVDNLVDRIKQAISNNDLSNIGYIYDEKEEISIVVKVGRSQRTINIRMGKARTWIVVDNVKEIRGQAEQLLENIRKEIGGSNVRSYKLL